MMAVLGAWQLFTGDTLLHQTRNMKRAKEHIPIVRSKLDAYPEFRHVTVVEYTAAGGSLLVDGCLRSDADVKRLRQIVQATAPPVEVVFQLITTNAPK